MTASFTLTVQRIVHARADGAAIFAGLTDEGLPLRVVAGRTALAHVPGKGDTLQVAGAMTMHPTYGPELIAKRCIPIIPRGRLIVHYLSGNRAFEGLGPVKAQRLWDHFGERLIEMLDAGDSEALAEVLTDELATKVCAVWAEQARITALINRLDELGFDVRVASKLVRVWGERAAEMLDRNPYYMLAFTSWKTADAAATKLAIAADDDRRLVGAVEACLYERLASGHTLTPHADLTRLLAARIDGAFIDRAAALAQSRGATVGSETIGWQPIGAASLEQRIEARLRGSLASEQLALPFAPDSTPTWLDYAINESQKPLGFALNEEQRAAVRMVVASPVSLLLGGAGVGKTVVLRVIIDVMERMHHATVQVALAGRAAKRMSEATGRPAMTIAKLLLLLKNDELELTASTLLIVDEASMLDLPTMYRMLHFLPSGVRLLLVGDPAQLPPIGFGLVFHRLADVRDIPHTVLTQVHRQHNATGIPAAAGAIRAHEVPSLGRFIGKRDGVSFIECDTDSIQGVLDDLAEQWAGEDWRIICATKSGPAGIDAINERMHGRNPLTTRDSEYAPGDPVLHLANDYERGLMNGTLGTVVAIADDARVTVDFEGSTYTFNAGEVVERLSLAYAVSCHKAQGSQFDRVAVVVTRSRILDHSLVYTAVTRAVKQVVLVGSNAVFAEAVRNPPHAHLRRTRFFDKS